MAAENSDETKECVLQWKLENISQCSCMAEEKRFESPTFITNAVTGTKWSLWFYPKGMREESKNYVGIYLSREKDCNGPSVLELKFQLAFLDKDGSILMERTASKNNFSKGSSWGFNKFETFERVFAERNTFISEDTLTVQCTIWNTTEKAVRPIHLYARTVFRMYRRSFVWKIDKFCNLQPGLGNKIKVGFIDFDLVISENTNFDSKIIIKINFFDARMKNFSFKTAILDSEKRKESCGLNEYFPNDFRKVLSFTPLFPKTLLDHNSPYLPNGVLSLDCEYAYSTQTNLHDFFDSGIISPVNDDRNQIRHNVGKIKSQKTTVLSNDFKSLYNDGIFSDVKLCTSTQTFPTHKAILSARSPVFKKMFSIDMKEKSSGCVEITDLGDDTIHQILMYIYTDSLEGLQFESACKLYSAADKYQIQSLKNRCSAFLKDNLCPTVACDVLMLADLHQDEDLKHTTEVYILEHDEVLSSLEWKHFMDSNVKVAVDIMYRKIYTGKTYRSVQNRDRWYFPKALFARLWSAVKP